MAISEFVRSWATSTSTSSSRAVSGSIGWARRLDGAPGGQGGAGFVAKALAAFAAD